MLELEAHARIVRHPETGGGVCRRCIYSCMHSIWNHAVKEMHGEDRSVFVEVVGPYEMTKADLPRHLIPIQIDN